MRFALLSLLLILAAAPAGAAPEDAYAQYALAGRYMTGNGVSQDDKQAAVHLRKAADQGLAIAQYYLSRAYASGKGLPQDDSEAYFWVTLAAAGGDKFIQDYRDELQGKLTNAQVADIQRRAAAWRPAAL